MAHAPNYDICVIFMSDGTYRYAAILGCFRHKETDAFFEYADRSEVEPDWAEGHPCIIFMSDGTYRYAAILKTVAYVVVDENEYGCPVIEKWQIKQHKVY